MTLSPVQSLCDYETLLIASGASLSAGMNLNGRILCGIIIPAAGWTAAGLTFQASVAGTIYGDVWNKLGEVSYTLTAAGAHINLEFNDFIPWRYIKVRSGTSGAAVNQAADRTLILVCGEASKGA